MSNGEADVPITVDNANKGDVSARESNELAAAHQRDGIDIPTPEADVLSEDDGNGYSGEASVFSVTGAVRGAVRAGCAVPSAAVTCAAVGSDGTEALADALVFVFAVPVAVGAGMDERVAAIDGVAVDDDADALPEPVELVSHGSDIGNSDTPELDNGAGFPPRRASARPERQCYTRT